VDTISKALLNLTEKLSRKNQKTLHCQKPLVFDHSQNSVNSEVLMRRWMGFFQDFIIKDDESYQNSRNFEVLKICCRKISEQTLLFIAESEILQIFMIISASFKTSKIEDCFFYVRTFSSEVSKSMTLTTLRNL